jgi:hypothetical protein
MPGVSDLRLSTHWRIHMFSDPGHPQGQDTPRHHLPPRRPPSAREDRARECVIGVAVLLGTLGMGWLFRLAPFG